MTCVAVPGLVVFQPTLPLRGATDDSVITDTQSEFQPTLPLGGARSIRRQGDAAASFHPPLPLGGATTANLMSEFNREFQPTLPLRGATLFHDLWVYKNKFQPTLPLRGATAARGDEPVGFQVSTHAPLAGSDRRGSPTRAVPPGFNPRSPCGERPRTPPA